MPYPFAHPAAVLPLMRPMGRFAVPSALAIGSIVPDLWYFVPFVSRLESHSAAALVWFCLPAGLLAYAMFHRVLKQPLIALISTRLEYYACRGFPAAPWYAVLASVLAGAATHIAWDALTHSEDHAIQGINWPQHASTMLGTLVLAAWLWAKLRRVPPARPALPARLRIGVALALLTAMGLAACGAAADAPTLRLVVRNGGLAAVQALALAIFVYCAVWHYRTGRTASA